MLKVFFLLLVVIFSASFIYLFSEIQNIKSLQVEKTSYVSVPNPRKVDDNDYKELIKMEVAQAMSSIAAQKAIPLPTPKVLLTPSSLKKQTTYIPFGSVTSTVSTDWVDAAGNEVYIDVENDYDKGAVVTFEATLKIADGSGKAYARLFDFTHSIAVLGSEVEVGSENYGTSISKDLSLWRGKNLYKVQIKSLNSQQATFGNGRIKITY